MKYEQTLLDVTEIRDANAHLSREARFGISGCKDGHIFIHNDHDQIAPCILQVRADGAADWLAISTTNIAANSVGGITLAVPYSVIRVSVTYAIAPTAGDLAMWLTRVWGAPV